MRTQIRSYKDLRVWSEGQELAVLVYRLSAAWPAAERYGLTSQVRRAAASVPANIAEGYGRSTRASYVNFLRIARGSLKEVESHIDLAIRLGFSDRVAAEASLAKADDLGRMLGGLLRRLDPS